MQEWDFWYFSIHMLKGFPLQLQEGFHFPAGRGGRGPLKGKGRFHTLEVRVWRRTGWGWRTLFRPARWRACTSSCTGIDLIPVAFRGAFTLSSVILKQAWGKLMLMLKSGADQGSVQSIAANIHLGSMAGVQAWPAAQRGHWITISGVFKHCWVPEMTNPMQRDSCPHFLLHFSLFSFVYLYLVRFQPDIKEQGSTSFSMLKRKTGLQPLLP